MFVFLFFRSRPRCWTAPRLFSSRTHTHATHQCSSSLLRCNHGRNSGIIICSSLPGENEKTCLPTDAVHCISLDMSSSLIGKILAPRVISFDQIASLFKKLWNPKGSFSCRPLDDNVVLFSFGNLADKKRVQLGAPWLLDKYLMLLQDAAMDMVVSNLIFKKSAFWIQLHGLPLGLLNKSFATLAGNSIGSFLGIDCDLSGSVIGKFLRIRVEIDVSKPLCRVLHADFKGQTITISLKYERLPDFCFFCGIIGHTLKDCDNRVLSNSHMNDLLEYGNWLRALPSSTPFASNRRSSRPPDNTTPSSHTNQPTTHNPPSFFETPLQTATETYQPPSSHNIMESPTFDIIPNRPHNSSVSPIHHSPPHHTSESHHDLVTSITTTISPLSQSNPSPVHLLSTLETPYSPHSGKHMPITNDIHPCSPFKPETSTTQETSSSPPHPIINSSPFLVQVC